MSGPIQWYPGHIAKVDRELTERLKLIDVVVEVVDARLPISTRNPRLIQKIQSKPVLVLLNKTDLSDPKQNQRWISHLKTQVPAAMLYESIQGNQKKALIDVMVRLGEEKMLALEKKGLKRRPIRICIVGMPNVGKSTLINNIVGQKKAQTGHKAGVTRQTQWIRIHPKIELMDTPGIIPPTLESEESGQMLAVVSGVGEAAFDDQEVAQFLLDQVEQSYPGLLYTHFEVPLGQPMNLDSIAISRHYLQGGGSPDTLRTAQAVLKDFRQGRMGRITLETC